MQIGSIDWMRLDWIELVLVWWKHLFVPCSWHPVHPGLKDQYKHWSSATASKSDLYNRRDNIERVCNKTRVTEGKGFGVSEWANELSYINNAWLCWLHRHHAQFQLYVCLCANTYIYASKSIHFTYRIDTINEHHMSLCVRIFMNVFLLKCAMFLLGCVVAYIFIAIYDCCYCYSNQWENLPWFDASGVYVLCIICLMFWGNTAQHIVN